MTTPLKIAISGAAGNIGYSLAFRIAAGAMFGDQRSVTLSLLDSPRRNGVLRGMELELTDCALPLVNAIDVTNDPDKAFELADWIIMLATVPMTLRDYSRIDLLRANISLYQAHGQAIERVAPTARVLVVAEPCNSLCLLVQRQAHTVPAEHFFSLTYVDRMRATALIATRANVPVSQVRGVGVWGNRSDSAYVDIHNATINGIPAEQVIADPNWSRNVLEHQVAERSHEVISFLGKPATATATQAILSTIRSITTPTPYGRRFSAGVVSDGSYGVPKGLVFGFPLRTEDGHKWSIVQGLYLDEYALTRLEANVAELEREAAIAGL